jgi:mannose-6-phosphate isomerase
VQAEHGAQVLIGTKSGVTKRQFLDAIANNTVENLLEKHSVFNGDTFFVPAGTPHTIGPGMVLCEIQEYSDLTYRVYDYGRVDAHGNPRELHVEKALEVMKFGSPVNPSVKSLPLPSHDAFKFLLAACRYFGAERWEFEWDSPSKSNSFHFEILLFLGGNGILNTRGIEHRYQSGECWLIPASLGQFELKPRQNTSLIVTYVPDLSALHRELRQEGIPEANLGRVLFE